MSDEGVWRESKTDGFRPQRWDTDHGYYYSGRCNYVLEFADGRLSGCGFGFTDGSDRALWGQYREHLRAGIHQAR